MTARIKPIIFSLFLLPLAWLSYCFTTSGLGANPVEKIIHDTGDWALNFLMLVLLITPLSDITGSAWISGLRRMPGLFSLFYAWLHVLAYAGLEQQFSLPSIVSDVLKHKRLLLGFFTLLILTLLAITSIDTMKRKLGKQWRALHRLTYLAAIGGVIHYLWMVKIDKSVPLIYASILFCLFLYRAIKWISSKTRFFIR